MLLGKVPSHERRPGGDGTYRAGVPGVPAPVADTRQTPQERRELRREYLDGLLLDEAGELRRPRGMQVKVFDALVNELFTLEYHD